MTHSNVHKSFVDNQQSDFGTVVGVSKKLFCTFNETLYNANLQIKLSAQLNIITCFDAFEGSKWSFGKCSALDKTRL